MKTTKRRKYAVTKKVLRQRADASKKAAEKRIANSKNKTEGWRSAGVTKGNKEWAILNYGSVNEAITELRERDRAVAAKKPAKRKGVR